MKWIIDDIRRALAQLTRWQFWLVVSLLGVFAGLGWLISRYAFRTDNILSYLHLTQGACRTMTNGPIIAMFSCMIFFLLTALLTLGEVQRHIEARRRAAWREMRRSLIWACVWGISALAIGVGALLFFKHNCY
ncbi:MAG: hypothetical protein LWW83_14260 [Azonexaceae bacterium]|nr:hypothetical protein [Azonexaceae bacterium]